MSTTVAPALANDTAEPTRNVQHLPRGSALDSVVNPFTESLPFLKCCWNRTRRNRASRSMPDLRNYRFITRRVDSQIYNASPFPFWSVLLDLMWSTPPFTSPTLTATTSDMHNRQSLMRLIIAESRNPANVLLGSATVHTQSTSFQIARPPDHVLSLSSRCIPANVRCVTAPTATPCSGSWLPI